MSIEHDLFSGTVTVPSLVLAATITFGGAVFSANHRPSIQKVIELIGILLSICRNISSRHWVRLHVVNAPGPMSSGLSVRSHGVQRNGQPTTGRL
jgi:hypothetical protein